MSELKTDADPAEVGLDPDRLRRIDGTSPATSTTAGCPAG